MALSDWDMAAWDDLGRPTGARLAAGPGLALEIARASLCVEDEASWTEGGDWARPTVARLHRADAGLHEISGIRILVARGRARQQVLRFLAAWDGRGGPRVVGGIACYGWTETFDVLAETCRRLGVRMGRRSDWGTVSGCGRQGFVRGAEELVWWRGREDERGPCADIRPGVLPVDHAGFLEWARGVADDPSDPLRAGGELARWLGAVRASGCLRISQGDALIADHTGMNELPLTPPGEAALPMLNVALGAWDRPPITRMPHRPLADWIHERALLAHRTGKPRPGLARGSAPAIRRRLDEALAREEAERWVPSPSERMRRRRERAAWCRQLKAEGDRCPAAGTDGRAEVAAVAPRPGVGGAPSPGD